MKAAKIKSIKIRGFRAFGKETQALNFDSDIAVIWGPNSRGKTSLAEAFEFLLTGELVRRQLTVSARDEFSDALRNAHLDTTDTVFAEAIIISADGTEHIVRRTLTSDYSKQQECTSLLEIDGKASDEAGLCDIGIKFSQPPLRVPVLSQYSLGYLFSARPQDRATYFKNLLEVTDLEDFRNETASLEDELSPPKNPVLLNFEKVLSISEINQLLVPFYQNMPSNEELEKAFIESSQILIEGAGGEFPENLSLQIKEIESILNTLRGKTFPINGFKKQPASDWTGPSDDPWSTLESYIIELDKIDEETRRLTTLFKEALKIPSISFITDPIICPLCDTIDALTVERVEFIRSQIAETENFQKAKDAAIIVLNKLDRIANNSAALSTTALPHFLRFGVIWRKQNGFTIPHIEALIGKDAAIITPWLKAIRVLLRAAINLKKKSNTVLDLLKLYISDPVKLNETTTLKNSIKMMGHTHENFVIAYKSYLKAEQALSEQLNAVIDEQSNTSGWKEFIELARDLNSLRSFLVDLHARKVVLKALQKAIRDIDRAKEMVLQGKFSLLSDSIQKWWNWLRPDEPTFFSGLRPRPHTRRTIDLKAGLSAYYDSSPPKIRDAIAVFSNSQLHCLGVSLFLARAEHEGTGFIILDDPILSSDEDYRVHFNRTVLTQLLNSHIQVILLTQDQKTWRDLESYYRHVDISMFQINIENPVLGAQVYNTSNELLSRITRAHSFAGSENPEIRGISGKILRDAGERFCKEILVKASHDKGDMNASLNDYDGKTLDWFYPRVTPLLINDPSHAGKLKVFIDAVNPPSHDDDIPGRETMRVACGDLRKFAEEYLDL